MKSIFCASFLAKCEEWEQTLAETMLEAVPDSLVCSPPKQLFSSNGWAACSALHLPITTKFPLQTCFIPASLEVLIVARSQLLKDHFRPVSHIPRLALFFSANLLLSVQLHLCISHCISTLQHSVLEAFRKHDSCTLFLHRKQSDDFCLKQLYRTVFTFSFSKSLPTERFLEIFLLIAPITSLVLLSRTKLLVLYSQRPGRALCLPELNSRNVAQYLLHRS